MRKARALAMALAVAALAMLLVSGPGTKHEWWGWVGGIWLLRGAAYAGLCAAAISLVLIVLLAVPKWRVRPWVPVVSLCIGLAAAVPPLILVTRAKAMPPIHDITTDTIDPPNFVALLEVRNTSPNGAAYGGAAIAAQQQRVYQDIAPKVLNVPPAEALQKCIDAARSLGWQVAASDLATGRLEATDTSTWFGFKDDLVIRVRPHGTGSRVDARSASRVGVSDTGTNANRIRAFLARL